MNDCHLIFHFFLNVNRMTPHPIHIIFQDINRMMCHPIYIWFWNVNRKKHFKNLGFRVYNLHLKNINWKTVHSIYLLKKTVKDYKKNLKLSTFFVKTNFKKLTGRINLSKEKLTHRLIHCGNPKRKETTKWSRVLWLRTFVLLFFYTSLPIRQL